MTNPRKGKVSKISNSIGVECQIIKRTHKIL